LIYVDPSLFAASGCGTNHAGNILEGSRQNGLTKLLTGPICKVSWPVDENSNVRAGRPFRGGGYPLIQEFVSTAAR